MDRNMEKEWTGVTYSDLLCTIMFLSSVFDDRSWSLLHC